MFSGKHWVLMAYISLVALLLLPSCSRNNYGSRYSSTKKRSEGNMSKRSSRPSDYDLSESHSGNERKKPSESYGKNHRTREKIIFTAEKYLGIPYKSGGKKPETGFDCSGFTGFIFSQNGYPMSGGSHELARMGKEKSKEKLVPGDLVFFGNKERISHVAIVSDVDSGKLEVIHSTTSAGVKKDNILGSPYWESRYLFGMDIIDQSK